MLSTEEADSLVHDVAKVEEALDTVWSALALRDGIRLVTELAHIGDFVSEMVKSLVLRLEKE